MKELILKIKYDATNGYKGHGEDVDEMIVNSIDQELSNEFEADGIIKPNWTLEIL
jgi:hypothetical protein